MRTNHHAMSVLRVAWDNFFKAESAAHRGAQRLAAAVESSPTPVDQALCRDAKAAVARVRQLLPLQPLGHSMPLVRMQAMASIAVC